MCPVTLLLMFCLFGSVCFVAFAATSAAVVCLVLVCFVLVVVSLYVRTAVALLLVGWYCDGVGKGEKEVVGMAFVSLLLSTAVDFDIRVHRTRHAWVYPMPGCVMPCGARSVSDDDRTVYGAYSTMMLGVRCIYWNIIICSRWT